MNKLKVFLLLFISASSLNMAFAQKGTIRGTIIEAVSGEPMIGVTVVLKGSTIGSITDFDGKFEIKADPGVYDIQSSFISYHTVTVTGVKVASNEVTVIDVIRMNEAVEQLQEVVVTAEAVKVTEAALFTVKRKSANLLDGISAANFRKIGDGDAAGAIKRVTGVNVEGGKYVYVRGLGDRYTKTMLNSVDIPGLDPDRNTLQIDIFPTNLIDNMIVSKSATADLPADFTGGVVNIETKDFPEEKIMNVSFGLAYNPSFHLRDDFLAYEGDETDILGFDSGTRDLPSGARGDLPVPGQNPDNEVFEFNDSFNPNLGAAQQSSFMDYNLSATFGNQYNLGNNKLGLIISGTYKSNRSFYDDLIFGEYQIQSQEDVTELIPAFKQTGAQGVESILIGGLAGIALKTANSKFRLTALHLQNGESTASQLDIVDDPMDGATGRSGFVAYSNNLEYFERSLTNFLLSGEHHFKGNAWKIDWRISPTFSNIDEPDIRKTAFSVTSQGDVRINPGQAGLPTRIWRYLDEVNIVGKVDVTRKIQFLGNDGNIKFGASHTYKERHYEILQYQMAFTGRQPIWSGDPDEILQDEYLFPNGNGYFQSGNADPNPNAYNANVNNLGLYVSTEVSPTKKLRSILGLRAENFVQRHTGRDIRYAQSGTEGNNLDNDRVLEGFNFFPSANVIYALNEEQNLRFSYSRTVARPSFKELSFAQILDPVSNRIFNGGLFSIGDEWDGNLKQTFINNIDLRWERYIRRGQLFSVSAFYKSFQDPIELVRVRQAFTTNEFQPRNVGDAQVYGAEFEVRKSLDIISPKLTNLSFSTNVTLVKSRLEMSITEFEARKSLEKTGQEIERYRQMAGQAPYVINAGISYESYELGLDAGLFYNLQGETLTIVGGGLFPDVYSEPFHSLNFNMNKQFGKADQFGVNFGVSNILGDVTEQFYQGFEAQDQYFSRRDPGTTISFGLKYDF